MRMVMYKTLFKVERKEINYIQSIMESYDGMAGVTTIDPEKAIIEVRISPGCETMVFELIDSLKKHDKVMISRHLSPINIF